MIGSKKNITGIAVDKKEEKAPQFKCRICGHDEYEGIYDTHDVPLGGRAYPKAYRCCGCSVIFASPEKFSATANPISHPVYPPA